MLTIRFYKIFWVTMIIGVYYIKRGIIMCSISAISAVHSPNFKSSALSKQQKRAKLDDERLCFNSAIIGLSAIGVASIAMIALNNKNIARTVSKKSDTFINNIHKITEFY